MKKILWWILRAAFRWGPFPNNARSALWAAKIIGPLSPGRRLRVGRKDGEIVAIFFEDGEVADLFWMEKELYKQFKEDEKK